MATIYEIFEQNYESIYWYVKEYSLIDVYVETKTGISFLQLAKSTDEQIGNWFQLFWENLPDEPSIRYGAFFTICDIAEQYCFGTEE